MPCRPANVPASFTSPIRVAPLRISPAGTQFITQHPTSDMGQLLLCLGHEEFPSFAQQMNNARRLLGEHEALDPETLIQFTFIANSLEMIVENAVRFGYVV